MFQIAIDTDTMPVSPAVYADEYRGRALPTVLPLVQGFRGNLRVYFLGEHAPSENAAVALYLRALQSKEKLVQTGLGTRGISDAGNVYYDVPLAADTTALSAVLGNRENVIMRAGIVANDVTASPQTNFEWQLNIAVSASAVGTGEKPPVSPNAIEEHNNDVAAHPFILQKIAAAEVDVSGLRASIAGVSESLNATNTNLNNAKSELSTEISEVSAALAAETIARENEDAAIRAALESETIARSEAIEEERNALVNTATGLQNSINSERVQRLQNEAKLSSRILEEANCRIAEDAAIRAALEGEMTARESQAESISEALTSERSERESEDAKIRNELDLRVKCVLETALHASDEEMACRINADSSEKTCRINADSSEKTCRINADNAIRGSINTLNADVAAIEGNIQNLENIVDSAGREISDHIINTNPHWSIDIENNVIKKTDEKSGSGILVASNSITDSCLYRGIYIQPNCVCGCFSPIGDLIKFGNNGCISLSTDSGISLLSGSEISLLSGSESISLSTDSGISLLSGSGISISSGSGISLLSGSGISISSVCNVNRICVLNEGLTISSKTLRLHAMSNPGNICMFAYNCIEIYGRFMTISAESTINVYPGNAKYKFNNLCLSLCRAGGAILQGNSSKTALYFGTTAFATSKIDSGSRVVCFGNPLGNVNIKAGNGGRIDICATCVYVNGVKIST